MTASTDKTRNAKALCDAVRAHLASRGETGIDLHPMPDTGLAHDHIWIRRRHGPDWVARLPKQSQMQLGVEDNLDFQAHCYRRTSESGHTPTLHGRRPIDATLPRGGLLVTAIHGRPARLPEDLPAIAEALAAIHRLPLPAAATRPPLASAASPWQAMREEVMAQAHHLDTLPSTLLDREARRHIDAALASLDGNDAAAAGIDTRRCLISFDAHPGNFLITPEGKAVLVDLEKCRYSHPGFDLAHASLYTSTTWDPASHAVLEPDTVIQFYRQWQAQIGANNPLADEAALLAQALGLPGLPASLPDATAERDLERAAVVACLLGRPRLIILPDLPRGLLAAVMQRVRLARDGGAAVLWVVQDDGVPADSALPLTRRLRLGQPETDASQGVMRP